MERIKKDIEKHLAEIQNKNIRHYIGVSDTSYCLTLRVDDDVTFLLCNTRIDPAAFGIEINNLAKYFNATIIREE